MNKIKVIIIPILSLLFALTIVPDAYPVSSSVKSQEDYYYTLNIMRSIDIMVKNFGDEPLNKRYDQVKVLFGEAGKEFYSQNFDVSYQKFRKIKKELISMLESLTQTYLDRTKEILDKTQEKTFDILIVYSSKNTGFIAYFRKSFDPLNPVKVYKSEEFRYFYYRERIETYLKNGYKSYQRGLNVFNDPDIKILKDKMEKYKNIKEKMDQANKKIKEKDINPDSQNFIIDKYLAAIYLCREAKQNGIEVFRILHSKELEKSLTEFGVSGSSLDPIFDYRIPDEYKKDANDNLGLNHSIEMKRKENWKK